MKNKSRASDWAVKKGGFKVLERGEESQRDTEENGD